MDKKNIAHSTGAASDTLKDESSDHHSIQFTADELKKVPSHRPSLLSQQDLQSAKKNASTFTIYIGLCVAMFMASLNSTVIAPAMGKISAQLNDVEDATWIATAYLVAFNATQPLYGKVSFSLIHQIKVTKALLIHYFYFCSPLISHSFLTFSEGKSNYKLTNTHASIIVQNH